MSAAPRRRSVLIGAAVVAVLVVVAGVIAIVNAADDRATVTATFVNASPIVEGNSVRAGGVEVGLVSAISIVNGKAQVELSLDRAVMPLHEDASLRLRPVNLLGERYLELNAGSPSAPLMEEPGTIPESRTGATVDLQDIVDSLANPTGTALATTVTSLGEGLDGGGGKAAGAIKALQPALADTGRLAGVLNDQNAVLTSLLDRVRPVAAELGDADGRTLDRVVGSAQQALGGVTAERQALDQTLAQLPETLVSARRTLGELAGVARAGTPVLADIRPVTDDLTQIAKEIEELGKVGDPALSSLPPVLDRADQLLDQLRPVVSELRKAGPDLRADAKNLRPLGDVLLDRNLNDLMDFVRKWSISTNGKDGLSHYFRGVLFFTPATLTEFLSNGPVLGQMGGAVRLPGLPNVPGLPGVPGLPDAGLASAPGPLPALVPGGAPAAPRPAPADPRSATGLSSGQESSMVGQLLGGR